MDRRNWLKKTLNSKSRPSASGVGLEEDAILTLAEVDRKLTVKSGGLGSVEFTDTAHDPLDEIEIIEVLRGTYV